MITILSIILQQSLWTQLDERMADPRFANSFWSASVVDIDTGKTVFERMPRQLMIGGSVIKLFSCAAVLNAVGADHKFATEVLTNGRIDKDGTLSSDLVLKSTDPTLGARIDAKGQLIVDDKDHTYGKYGGTPFSGDPSHGLKLLARQLANQGIKRVKGKVLAGPRSYEPDSVAGVYPLGWNEGMLDVSVRAHDRAIEIEIPGKPKFLKVVSDLQLAETGETNIQLTLKQGELRVEGSFNPEAPYFDSVPLPDPERFALDAFREALAESNISISDADAKQGPFKRIAFLESPTAAGFCKIILKSSNNRLANNLLLTAASGEGIQNLTQAGSWMGEKLSAVGVKLDGLAISDGAGTHPSDRVSAAEITRLLVAAEGQPWGAGLKSALPILGRDGTLKDTLPDSKSAGMVLAKSGTLLAYDALNRRLFLTTKSIAGYVLTASGRRLAFAFIVNNVPLKYYEEVPRFSDRLAELADILYRKG